jgi:hypothetical protein
MRGQVVIKEEDERLRDGDVQHGRRESHNAGKGGVDTLHQRRCDVGQK